MALYDTSNPLGKANFLLRAKKLAESGKIVELTEKKSCCTKCHFNKHPKTRCTEEIWNL